MKNLSVKSKRSGEIKKIKKTVGHYRALVDQVSKTQDFTIISSDGSVN